MIKSYVVVDGVGAGHLLTDHEPDGEQGSLAVTRYCPHFLDDGPETFATIDAAQLFFQLTPHLHHLALYVWMVGWQFADVAQDLAALFPLVLPGEPSR